MDQIAYDLKRLGRHRQFRRSGNHWVRMADQMNDLLKN